jgi:glycosyltransferase involved in cell wall biosynthesis
MRLLFVVDGRSPIALNWISYFTGGEHEVHLASTFACEPPEGIASFHVTPVAFSGTKKRSPLAPSLHSRQAPLSQGEGEKPARRSLLWSAGLVGFRTRVRQWVGPLTFPKAAKSLAEVIQQVRPNLIHAMRIPYEGIIASLALEQLPTLQPPLLISVWGNDFTLHAASNPWMAAYTRRTMKAASALHTDCYRDQRLAYQWGFLMGRPAAVLPGGGGIQLDLFCPPSNEELRKQVVINPRGVRAYVRNDTFFKSIPWVLERFPGARFICTAMAGEAQALRWISELGIEQAVDLLPRQRRAEMAVRFQSAQVVVSPSTHDGTPNTLLEAMACGCYPVVGDIEALREWIQPGENGALVDPGDERALAEAVCEGLADVELRRKAAAHNIALVAERAEYGKVMREAEGFYRQTVNWFEPKSGK